MENFKINVLGESWYVKFDKINDCGICNPENKTIYINSSLDKNSMVITILHEMFHAYVRRSGIYNGMLSSDMEEIIADQFSTVISENFDFTI